MIAMMFWFVVVECVGRCGFEDVTDRNKVRKMILHQLVAFLNQGLEFCNQTVDECVDFGVLNLGRCEVFCEVNVVRKNFQVGGKVEMKFFFIERKCRG